MTVNETETNPLLLQKNKRAKYNDISKCKMNLSSKLETSPLLEDIDKYLLSDASLVKIEPEDLDYLTSEKTPTVSFEFRNSPIIQTRRFLWCSLFFYNLKC